MEHRVEVVKVKEVLPHPAADRLEIINAFDYPTIVKKGDFRPGDLGAFVPVDSVVPFTPYWEFVHGAKDDTRHRRVKAKKLRGIYSEGILVPLEDFGLNRDGNISVGENIAEVLHITKYEPPQPKSYGSTQTAGTPGIKNVQVPGFPRYTDLENIRRWPDVLAAGEEVVVHEKLHGANFRCGWAQVKDLREPWYRKLLRWYKGLFGSNLDFVVGSHSVFRTHKYSSRRDWHQHDGQDLWLRAAEQYRLAEKLEPYPYVVLFGEVYGDVQDLKYGHETGEISLAVFDVYHIKERRFYDAFETAEFLDHIHVPQPPLIYTGTWDPTQVERLRDGNTLVGQQAGRWTNPNGVVDQIREGFVVKPVMERVDPKLGRVILKAVSPAYLTRKEGTEGK